MLARTDQVGLPIPPNFPHQVISQESIWTPENKMDLEEATLRLDTIDIKEVERALTTFEDIRGQAQSIHCRKY